MKFDIENLPMILTPKEVAEFLGLTPGQAYRLFNSKKFPSEKQGGKHYIPKPRFLTWLGVEHRRDVI